MLDDATTENLVRETSLAVTYSQKRVPAQLVYTDALTEITLDWMWEYHRYATRQWKFVGMDYASAETAAERLREYYTRWTRSNDWNADGENAGTFSHERAAQLPMCEVAVVHSGGCMYEIQCRLNEDDIILSTSQAIDLPTDFSVENDRGYDECGNEEPNNG